MNIPLLIVIYMCFCCLASVSMCLCSQKKFRELPFYIKEKK